MFGKKSKSVKRREAIQKGGKKQERGTDAPAAETGIPVESEKQRLLALYDQLKALGITRISDLENLIAKAE